MSDNNEQAKKFLDSSDEKYNRGDYNGAIADCDKAITLNPDKDIKAEAYNNRGLAKFKLEYYDEAITDYDRAIALNPDEAVKAQAYNSCGTAKASLNRYDEAIADYDQAIKLDPGYAKAYYNRGLSKASLNRYDEAISDFDQAIILDPGDAEAYADRGATKASLNRYDEAIADFDQTIALDPDDAIKARAYYNSGNTKLELKRYAEAIADYDQSIALNPGDAEAYLNRGIAKAWLKRYDEAIDDYTKAIEFDLDYASAYYNRGLAYREIKREDKALKDFRKANQLDPIIFVQKETEEDRKKVEEIGQDVEEAQEFQEILRKLRNGYYWSLGVWSVLTLAVIVVFPTVLYNMFFCDEIDICQQKKIFSDENFIYVFSSFSIFSFAVIGFVLKQFAKAISFSNEAKNRLAMARMLARLDFQKEKNRLEESLYSETRAKITDTIVYSLREENDKNRLPESTVAAITQVMEKVLNKKNQ